MCSSSAEGERWHKKTREIERESFVGALCTREREGEIERERESDRVVQGRSKCPLLALQMLSRV
jgi:hypothetical protein